MTRRTEPNRTEPNAPLEPHEPEPLEPHEPEPLEPQNLGNRTEPNRAVGFLR